MSSSRMRSVEALLPNAYDRTVLGVIVQVGSEMKVNVQGNTVEAQWMDPVVCVPGDTVLVQLTVGKTGHTEAVVRGRVVTRSRPERGTVTVVPPSSQTVTVVGTDGRTYSNAGFLSSYTPVVNDVVLLSWWGSAPVITGKPAVSPSPPPPPPPPPAPVPPPPPPQRGISVYAAGETATLWPPGGWNSWAGGNGRVFQGQYGSGQVYGAAFYHLSPTQLKGRTIERLRFTLGPRHNAGNFNSPGTAHVFLTSNAYRPGGDVSIIDGPFDIGVSPGQGLTDYDLPTWWGAHITNGAGLSLRGDPYMGFKGRNEHPDAFKVILDWRM